MKKVQALLLFMLITIYGVSQNNNVQTLKTSNNKNTFIDLKNKMIENLIDTSDKNLIPNYNSTITLKENNEIITNWAIQNKALFNNNYKLLIEKREND